MDQKNKVDWLLLPLELWDYVFRYHIINKYDALRLAQTCTKLWGVYKGGGAKEWVWNNRLTAEVEERDIWNQIWKGRRCWNGKRAGLWRGFTGEQQWVEYNYVQGERHGLGRHFRDGEVRWEDWWVKDKRHGMERGWYRNGQLWWEKKWVNGDAPHNQRIWHQNGVLQLLDV